MGEAEITAQEVMKFCFRFKTYIQHMVQHMRSTVSLKQCRNLCSLRWLKFNTRLHNNLIQLISCISKTGYPLHLIKLRVAT